MNTTETNQTILLYAGNYEPEAPLEQLRETYLNAGLQPENALAAAIADYAHLFVDAA